MRISNINAYKPSFGHISSRTIDMIKEQIKGNYKMDDNTKYPNYSIPHYMFLDIEQLKRLNELTKRASELQKSVIDTSGNNWQNDKQQQFVVRSHCYGGGDRANKEIFTLPYNSLFEATTNDPNEILDTLEQAVEFAELAEKDTASHDIFDEYGWHGGVREAKSKKYSHDPFFDNRCNEFLSLIYSKTINLRTIE